MPEFLMEAPQLSTLDSATSLRKPFEALSKQRKAVLLRERIGFAVVPAPLGLGFALVASTDRGLCAVLLGNNPEELRAELQKRFRKAELHEQPTLAATSRQIFTGLEGGAPELALDLRATAFQ